MDHEYAILVPTITAGEVRAMFSCGKWEITYCVEAILGPEKAGYEIINRFFYGFSNKVAL